MDQFETMAEGKLPSFTCQSAVSSRISLPFENKFIVRTIFVRTALVFVRIL